MNLSQILVIATFLSLMLAVIAKKLRMDLAALTITASLAVMQYAGLGVLGPAGTPSAALRALSGFGQPPMVVLICLFIITSALEKSGFSYNITHHILKLGKGSTRRLILLFTAIAALLSQIMNNVAAGALLIPSALEAARRTGIKPSKLLIPVSFGSLLGGMATYFTTANILADNLLQNASPPQTGLGILSFAPTGGLILLCGLAFMAVSGDRLLVDPRKHHRILGAESHRQRTGRTIPAGRAHLAGEYTGWLAVGWQHAAGTWPGGKLRPDTACCPARSQQSTFPQHRYDYPEW